MARTPAMVLALLLCIVPAWTSGASTRIAGARVRCLDERIEQLLKTAIRQSQTVRDIVARLESSDLIVYVQFGTPTADHTNVTRLLGSSPSARFVLVTMHPLASPLDLAARLAHELQHVVEIAEAPEVRDQAGMRRLFRRIGWRSGRVEDDRWETDAAIAIGKRVENEVWTTPPPATTDAARAR